MTTQVFTDVDFEQDGKQIGHLGVPQSTNSSGWATEFIPIAVIKNGPGRTALLFGGNHGDEFEGPVALLKLMRSLQPEDVTGRLIIVPMLNRPAIDAGTRLSPIDGRNMNRAFPGREDDTLTGMIAHYVSSVLFPLTEIVIDVHSGGSSTLFLPSVNMHQVPDDRQMEAMVNAAVAWGAPYVFVYRDVGGTGLLPGYAESLGKITLGTEMGSKAQFGVETLSLTQSGVRNVLRHFGILSGEPQPPKTTPQVVGATERGDYIMAPVSGLLEPFIELGDAVAAGQAIGQIHFIEEPARDPHPVAAATDGIVMGRRAIPRTKQGECVATLVRPFN